MNGIDLNLMKLAKWRLSKKAFVPSDPAAGGDPSGGGAPPPGDPGMADGAAGSAPPPDPSAGGGGPPPGGDPTGGSTPMPPPDAAPPSPDMSSQIASGVAQALAQSGLQGNKGPTAPKPDINTVATDIFQLKKMFLHFLRMQGIELPPDILDGPNRDPMTGAPAVGPSGGSDAQPGSSMQQAGGAAPGGIKPIQPMGGSSGGGAGGGLGKMGSARIGEGITSQRVMSKAAATAMLLKRQRLVQV